MRKYNLDYTFDGYNISFLMYEAFYNQALSDIEKSKNISMITKQTNKTGYIDSLIVSNIDLSKITLDKFMTLNKKTVESGFVKYNQSKYSDLYFECNWRKIYGKLFNYNLILQNEIVYFSQYVFSQNKSWYLISLSTDNKKQSRQLVKTIKKIHCN